MRGKLIVIEGTDCSGKETQTSLLVEKLKEENILVERLSFPMYDTPTGKIIGACYLGKEHMCNELFINNEGWFKEGAVNVDPMVAIDLYAADRRYNMPKVINLLDQGVNVILDRYVGSNMAHQGGKILDKEERLKLFRTIEQKEYIINEIPRPDMTMFLYMPYEYAIELKKNREEVPDQHEQDETHLRNAEKTYLELAALYNYTTVKCVNNNRLRTIDDINNEVYSKVKKLIKNKS